MFVDSEKVKAKRVSSLINKQIDSNTFFYLSDMAQKKQEEMKRNMRKENEVLLKRKR